MKNEICFINNSDYSFLYYINDHTKNKRWIFPSNLQYPSFLNLYNSNTTKGFIYKQIVKIVFKLRLQKYFVSGVIKGELNEKYQAILKELSCTNYSIFTGTAGENRKVVIEVNDNQDTKYFIKIPTTKSATKLVQKEKENLLYLGQFNFNTFKIPKVAFSDEKTIAISNIKPSHIVKNDDFSNVHFLALEELYNTTYKKLQLEKVKTINAAIKNIDSLNREKFDFNDSLHIKIISLTTNLSNLKDMLLMDKEIIVSFSHQDFTPWNMYVSKDKLFIYDWELASHETPLLFDFFHYIFQQSILIKHESYDTIKEKMNSFLTSKTLQEILKKYNVKVDEYYSYYLIINISYYSIKYLHQEDLHIQAYWLIDLWNEALKDIVNNKGRIFELD
jgi:hypothetical protein